MGELDRLDNTALAGLALDFFRRSILHYGIWFSEVNHQLGLQEALQTEEEVFDKYFPLILKRLERVLGFEVERDLPAALSRLPRDKLVELIDATAANWLAGDGLWFQTVEKRQEMFTAKRCNDTCWIRFSPLEAYSIKDLANLPENGGLDALETALGYRLYSRINVQSTERQGNSLIFKMVNCRVQYARERKGIEDYPCKSAGVVEYSSFAHAVDPRIKTECIACPPDKHPGEWFCAWKFYIP
jgi:hypothetical protein